MSDLKITAGVAPVNQAQIYYERGGEGAPFVMIHAGVADSRQWENEFAHFADRFQVVRYDLRGFGRTPPAPRLGWFGAASECRESDPGRQGRLIPFPGQGRGKPPHLDAAVESV